MVMCKESSKPSKLSTKLSTIWQINDYLSKKIDNRLIVDIIDTRGHPADKKGTCIVAGEIITNSPAVTSQTMDTNNFISEHE